MRIDAFKLPAVADEIRLVFAYTRDMGLEVGGYEDHPDWPKMGPSLLIATCLILAIRTAKWSANYDTGNSNIDLAKEIDYAAHLAGRVFSSLISKHPAIFPTIKKPWYQPGDEDVMK